MTVSTKNKRVVNWKENTKHSNMTVVNQRLNMMTKDRP